MQMAKYQWMQSQICGKSKTFEIDTGNFYQVF